MSIGLRGISTWHSLARHHQVVCIAPVEILLNVAMRILSYFKKFSKGKVTSGTFYLDHSKYTTESHESWVDLYSDEQEEVLHDISDSSGESVYLTAHVNADHAHGLVTRWSVTGTIVMANNTLIFWENKCQKTFKSFTYGLELFTAQIVSLSFATCYR